MEMREDVGKGDTCSGEREKMTTKERLAARFTVELKREELIG